jgi:hypothetical protein
VSVNAAGRLVAVAVTRVETGPLASVAVVQ